jgi:uncharacterized membrane protein
VRPVPVRALADVHLLAAAAPGTTSLVVLVLAVFGASAVEMVEALTIVVAVGATRGWRTALRGAAAAAGTLAVLVVAGGVPLVRYAPVDDLRVAVGVLLLVLGLGWLRKAVLRAAGVVASHDEDAVYAATVTELSDPTRPGARGRDLEGFGVAFKGVFLEGIEVVVIVISLGVSQHQLEAASAAAGAAALVVAGVGAVVARQLSGVPENLMKLAVGVMLTSFGTFWIGEGAGVRWPGSDASLPVLVGLFALVSALLVGWAKRQSPLSAPARGDAGPPAVLEPSASGLGLEGRR